MNPLPRIPRYSNLAQRSNSENKSIGVETEVKYVMKGNRSWFTSMSARTITHMKIGML